jgi:hypothetical protein
MPNQRCARSILLSKKGNPMLFLLSLSATLLTLLTLLVVGSLARDVASLQTAVALLIVTRPHEHPETTTNHHQEICDATP